MSVAFVFLTSFNGHGSEHHLINHGRIEGETIRNNKDRKLIDKKEESLHTRTMEKNAMAKRNIKVTMAALPWE